MAPLPSPLMISYDGLSRDISESLVAVKGRLMPRFEPLPSLKSKLLRPESNENLASDTGGGRKGREADVSLVGCVDVYGTEEKDADGLWPGFLCFGGDGGGGMSLDACCWSLMLGGNKR